MAEEVQNATETVEVNTVVATPVVVEKKIRGFWELVKASWEIFTQAWKKYLVFFLAVTAMSALFVLVTFGGGALISYIETGGQTLDPTTFGSFGVVGIIGLLVLIPVSIVLQVAIYRSLYNVAAGTAESVQDSIKYGFANLLAFFGVSLLAGLMIFGATLLLIVPGIIVALMLSMYYPVFVIEGKRGMEVFRRSRELTKGYKWALLGKYLLVFLVYIGASIVVGILGSIVEMVPVVGVFGSSLLTQILTFIFSPMLIVFGYLMYKDLSVS